MANEKILNTRIQLRYDTYTNWYNNNPTLKRGEVAIATIPENHTDPSTGKITQIPAVVMKVGTGEQTGSDYRSLPFLSAKAADVLAACKSEEGLTAFINGVIADAGIASNEAMEALAGRVTKLEGDENTDGSVAKAIKDAIESTESKLIGDENTDDETANTIYGAKRYADDVVATLRSDVETDYVTTQVLTERILADYVEKEDGKSLVSDTEITKLAGVSTGANKVEASTNGKIKIDGVDTTVYTHPEKHTVAEISDFDDKVKAYDYATKAEAQGYANAKDDAIAAAKKAGDDAQADVDTLEGNVGAVDGLSTTNKTVVGAINEVLAAVGTGGTAAVVTVEKSTDGLTYTIKQGNATVGTIDIPKDMVVTAGEVVTNPAGQAAGTYIKLTLANVADPLYINVGTLVDIYKAKANATQVQVAIDSTTREISATIVAGSIGTTELADSAVVTAKIADANVTKAKLSTEVQTSLGKADSAVQETDIAGLRSASHTHTFVEAELNKIADGDVAKWNAAEQNAKDYTDDEIEALALGTMSKETADDYVKKTDATGYDDILTKTEAATTYDVAGAADTAIANLKKETIATEDSSTGVEKTSTAVTSLAWRNNQLVAQYRTINITKSQITDFVENDYAKNADLATIAKTGNINDLIQTEGDVLIFDCGTSAV